MESHYKNYGIRQSEMISKGRLGVEVAECPPHPPAPSSVLFVNHCKNITHGKKAQLKSKCPSHDLTPVTLQFSHMNVQKLFTQPCT